MPGQAIRCTLAHITIPPYLSQAARQTMTHIMDVTDSWIVKVGGGTAFHILDVEQLVIMSVMEKGVSCG